MAMQRSGFLSAQSSFSGSVFAKNQQLTLEFARRFPIFPHKSLKHVLVIT
jgi:hypothetical protein